MWLPKGRWRTREEEIESLGLANCKLWYIGWINNKVLFSRGKYIQYPVINHKGKDSEKECVYN